MPEHSLPQGRAVIDSLSTLGQALGYDVEREWAIPGTDTAIDVAWLTDDSQIAPLMIFEVESSASSSMANNVLKVLSRETDVFPKPLFFFHVILSGGAENDRIAGLRRQWGTHNYRVYRLNAIDEAERLVTDVLTQHRRVRSQLSVGQLYEALQERAFAQIELIGIFKRCEQLQFAANFLGDYAALALHDASLRPLLLEKICPGPGHPAQGATDRYYGSWGQYIPGLIEMAVLCHGEDDHGLRHAARFEAWQTRPHLGMRTIGPYFGLSRDYDLFILGSAPFMYAVAALLCRDDQACVEWLVSDLSSLVGNEKHRGFGIEYRTPALVWLAHIAAAGVHRQRTGAFTEHSPIFVDGYSLARQEINEADGLSPRLVANPPAYLNIDDLDERYVAEWSSGERVLLPELEVFNQKYAGRPELRALNDDERTIWSDPFRVGLAFLSQDVWPTWPTFLLPFALRASY